MPPEKQAPFQIQFSSGKGLLDARALWAGIVGPHRLAMAAKRPVEMHFDRAVEIYKNIGAAEVYAFIGVALPINAVVSPMAAIFGRDDQLGANTGTPQILNGQMGGGGLSVSGAMQILMPGEQLYGQITDPGVGAGGTQRVVVAAVLF